VVIKFNDKEYHISQEMWDAMNQHAAKRDMTIDEYIAEAFTKLRETENENTRH
tara:strand:+ start:45 stop:203 length:159 start_codon:yes stop_codon:yes gene_type:complete